MADPDATAVFFEQLARRGHEPRLGRTRATVRFEVVDGERTDRWLLRIRDGDLELTEGDGGAGESACLFRTDRATFDQLATGRRNPMAATLRGALELEGDARLLVRVQRLFPDAVGMPEASGARSTGRRRS